MLDALIDKLVIGRKLHLIHLLQRLLCVLLEGHNLSWDLAANVLEIFIHILDIEFVHPLSDQ